MVNENKKTLINMNQEQFNPEELTEEQLKASVIQENDMPEIGSFYSSLQVASILLKLMKHDDLNKAEGALYDIFLQQKYEEVKVNDETVGIRVTPDEE